MTSKQIQKLIWQECRRITKVAEATKCYTCGADLTKKSRHLGHFIPKAYLPVCLKYDTMFLRPQCYYCNINLGGNGAMFYYNLCKEVGRIKVEKYVGVVNALKTLPKRTTKQNLEYYTKLLAEIKRS